MERNAKRAPLTTQGLLAAFRRCSAPDRARVWFVDLVRGTCGAPTGSVYALAAIVLLSMGCERAGGREAVREVEDRLKYVRCRLDHEGRVDCRGLNTWGLVRAPAEERVVSVWTRIPLPERAVDLQIGELSRFACALAASGHVYCWGDASEGKLGNGVAPENSLIQGVTAQPTPQRVRRLDDAVSLGLGVVQACALTRSTAVLCWGAGRDWGSLGVAGDPLVAAEPVRVIESGASEIVVTALQTCAIVGEGARCWGGYVPDEAGHPRRARMPTLVPGTAGATTFSVDNVTVCAVGKDGRRTCWNSLPDDLP